MLKFRKLYHDDFEDIVDISKGVWDGGDYLPLLFHKWVDDKGYFFGVVDTENNKVVGVAKFTVLHDGSGWLEGLRVHKNYRGQKIGRLLSEEIIKIASEELKKGNINKIAFSSHVSNKESITLMGKLGFKLKHSEVLIIKEYEDIDKSVDLSDFEVQKWDISYDEFMNLPYFKRRNNLLPLAFVFEEPTVGLFEEYKEEGYFTIINGFRGIVKFKAEINFIAVDESFEAINTFMNYYLLKYMDKGVRAPWTSILEDEKLIEKLKENKYTSWNEWNPDYVYYVYE